MSKTSGYPTPDEPIGDVDFVCIPVVVPDNEAFQAAFKAAIYGLYGQMANEWFWREFGTMSPSDAAMLASRGLAQTEAYGECGYVMACEDVADCFESEIVTNTTLQNAVTQYVNQAGFGNPNHVNALLTTPLDKNPVGYFEEEIKPLANCNLDVLWGGIRYGIVQRMDDTVRDVLEDLTSIADIPERIEVFLDIIPVIGDIAEALLVQLSEAAPDLLNLYNAHSSEATLDELACEIFSLVCHECRYPTHEELYNYYKNFGAPATPSIADFVLEVMSELVAGSVAVIAKVAYFTLQTWHLGILYLQAKFAGNNGSRALIEMATLGEDFANDNWLQLCDSCNELYMRYDWDLLVSNGNMYVTGGYTPGQLGTYMPGIGWQMQATDASSGIINIGLPLNPTWKIRAWAFQTIFTPSTLTVQFRPTRKTATGASSRGASNGTTGWKYFENGLLSLTGYSEFALRIPNALSTNQTLIRIAMIFDAGFAPSGAQPTAIATFSGTVYP